MVYTQISQSKILLSALKALCINSFVNLKDRVATEDKNNIVYEIDCTNSQAVYLGESEQSLKLHSDEHKRSVRNCDCDKNEIAKHCWEADYNFCWGQKKLLIGKAG